MERVELRKAPVHRLAVAALATAAVAGVLALYGSFMAERHIDGSPLNVARNADGLEDIRSAPGLSLLIRLAAFVLPWAMGLGACWMGAEAMRRVERSNGSRSGNLPAVFAIMIGGLATVVAGCMTVAVFVWKFVPDTYPT